MEWDIGRVQSAKELLGFDWAKVDKVKDLTFDIEQMAPVFKRVDDETGKSLLWAVPFKNTVKSRLWN